MQPRPLLCGERGCKPIEGFDLGNSPAEYAAGRVRGRRLILTTTNGTRAIAAAHHVPRVLVASFLNLSAVMASIRDNVHVHLVCAGTNGQITLEDALLAGAISWMCTTERTVDSIDDETTLVLQLWKSWFSQDIDAGRFPTTSDLSRRFRESSGGKNLVRLGLDADLDRCAAIDSIRSVPRRLTQSPATFGLES